MNTNKLFLMIAVISFIFCNVKAQETTGLEGIIKEGAVLEKLADGFDFTEGPTIDKKGNIYFTDQPNNRIMVYNFKTGLSVYLEPALRSNGLFMDKKGYLWSCADEKNQIIRISPKKKVEIISGTFDGKPYNGPNDIWITSTGHIYFTDPFYVRKYWNHTNMPQDKECVYYIQPDMKTVIRVVDDLRGPNGIISTPDGKKLYVADIKDNKTWSYTINPDGSLTDKTLFCEMGSDGITLDSEGNLYLTGRGVTIFDKTGRRLGNISVPEGWTSNVCFGDKDKKSLIITASKGIYRIKTKVKAGY
jgi:gluconolactonase